MARLMVPVATYRLQFNREFRFEDAWAIVPYLHRLGISDVYASPVLKARRGSSHGYDVTDPSRLNPELGTERVFEKLCQELRARGMGFLLDIVPNHMAASPENPWWMDVLENGPCSPYASFFDIDWNPSDSNLENRVLLPVLGSPYDRALKNQQLALNLEDTGLFVRYRDLKFPLDVKSYASVLSHRLDKLEAALGASNLALQQLKRLIEAMERLHSSFDSVASVETLQKRQTIKEDLGQLLNSSPEVKAFLIDNITSFNGKKGDQRSFDIKYG
jgi:(1->4)-alpha-D-glucan 1-alpha-D-glucosylmutase